MKTPLTFFAPCRTGHAGSFPANSLHSGCAFLSSDGGGPIDAPQCLPSGSVAVSHAWAAWFPQDPPQASDRVNREPRL